MECLEALMAGKSEEMNVSTSFMEFRTKPCMMKSKQFFVSSEVPSKPVSSPALADKLVSINTIFLTSPARVREYFISENCFQIWNYLFQSRRTWHAISCLDRSTSETSRDKTKYTWHVSSTNHIWRQPQSNFFNLPETSSIEIIEDDRLKWGIWLDRWSNIINKSLVPVRGRRNFKKEIMSGKEKWLDIWRLNPAKATKNMLNPASSKG